MVWFIAGVYLAAGAVALLGLLAASFGAWGMGTLASVVVAVVCAGVEAGTRQGRRSMTPDGVAPTTIEDNEAASPRPHFIIWS